MKSTVAFTIIILLIISALALFFRYDRVNKQPVLMQTSTMDITSDVFEDNEAIPPQYGCEGEDVNPPLSFAGIPEETESLTLIVTDPDAPAGTWTHWIVFNIPPDTDEIDENSSPEDASHGVNDAGSMAWNGPCPPDGEEHRYVFSVYALDTMLDLPEGADRQAVEAAMEGHIIDQADLTGLYSH